ncbi:MAG: hypothetical protein RJQ08_02905 [Salinisphaeraceae bacterium]
MNRGKTLMTVAASAVLGASLAPAVVAAEREAGMHRIMVTDFSGRPPYDREFQTRDEAEARTYARPAPAVGDTVTVVDYRDRPPYRRQVVEIDQSNVTDFARFEEVEAVEREQHRFGPPGKNFRRTR